MAAADESRIRTMSRGKLRGVLERRQTSLPFRYREEDGVMSLLEIRRIAAPLMKQYGGRAVVIADEGYSWVQAALRDRLVWYTAVFDAKDRLVGICADITGGNITDADEPYFEDMYLDLVLLEPDGTVFVLNRADLDEARAERLISPAVHGRTLSESRRVADLMKRKRRELARFFTDALTELRASLDDPPLGG